MTDQFKIDKSIALEEAQLMQKALEEAHIKKTQVPENCEISVSYVHIGKNGIKIILLLTIFLLSKWLLIS